MGRPDAIVTFMHETSNVLNPEVRGELRYENTAWFARFMAWYRNEVAHCSQEHLDRSGGPSRGTQAPIEKGDAAVISEDTLSKYIRGYTEIVSSSHKFNVSLLRAVFAIFTDRGDHWDRIVSLRDTAESWTHEHQLFLGVMIPTGVMVTGHGLELESVKAQPEDGDHRDEFIRQACRIALSQPSVTLLPAEYQNNQAILSGLQRWRQVKPDGARRYIGVPANLADKAAFDPIANVADLNQAISRATALGAHGDDTIEMAWIILVANELAARTNRTPIDVVGTLFTEPAGRDGFSRLFDTLDTTPDFDALARLAVQVLGGWRNEYLTATVDVRLQTLDGVPTLRAQPEHSASIADIRTQSLWIYDPTRLPRLPDVIAAQHNSALVVTPERVTLHTLVPANTVYAWLPVDGDRGVMRDNSNRWIPIHMPSADGAPRRTDIEMPRYRG